MKTINHHLICPFQRRRCCAFDSHFKRRGSAEDVCRIDEPHRGSAFDSPGVPNDSAGYPGLGYGLWRITP